MNFDSPASKNPIDQLKVVGQPVDRIDGPLKTTGQAKYAYEQQDVVANQAYGVIVGSSIAKGSILSIDTEQARQVPGVLTIVTFQTVPSLKPGDFYSAMALAGPKVEHYHQAVAVAVADSLEQAQAAAELIRVTYQRVPGQYELSKVLDTADVASGSPDTDIGDFQAAFRTSAFQVDQRYRTPDQSHAMMEPHATVAAWDGDRVTLWTSIQIIQWGMRDLSKVLGISRENIRIVSPYIGGGFGGKASVLADAVLAAVASRQAKRPVKISLSRSMMFNNTTHRPATIQRVRLGADGNGVLQAIGHETWSGNLPGGPAEKSALPTASLYFGENRMTRTRLAILDLPEGNAMRAPGEAPGLMALEIAMDELAEKVGIDPVILRLRNDTPIDPTSGKRFSTRRFAECLRIGAERFGWSARASIPGTKSNGDWLVGYGVAGAVRGNNVTNSGARARLGSDGILTIETDMTDIGTGSYTIIGQTAAEMLGIPLENVRVKLGDSNFPKASGSLGQRGANSSTSGTYAACAMLRDRIAQVAGFQAGEVSFQDGQVIQGDRRVSLSEIASKGELVADDTMIFTEKRDELEHQTFGAHFCELRVHRYTGEVRVDRMLAVCDCGRILNPKTARSQVIGAMTMGLGAALMEDLVVDPRMGFFVNHDLASYEVPVHADIPEQEVIFIDEVDENSSPMKAKGVSELGISGVAAAVANAIYNATGIRIRNYPITLDKLIQHLPPIT
ncbi:aldehyde oxidoreductase molybdenum-binding subunit PaoC [Stutzerimonas nitrititolerans]|uniref:aldehyde oxidoreductase molybdenum-binding subunit PaoC n=1 Tax=Stutzerimonas nitrititolerans TaxID=2482751 RepID=UPI0015CB1F5A|nr:aldehyde oxidoreductase molybdenum-binding subunit PaoC [Stutzerimonas nitrititolerans]